MIKSAREFCLKADEYMGSIANASYSEESGLANLDEITWIRASE